MRNQSKAALMNFHVTTHEADKKKNNVMFSEQLQRADRHREPQTEHHCLRGV